jgi:DNA-binding HxlR family transcriptional regulator
MQNHTADPSHTSEPQSTSCNSQAARDAFDEAFKLLGDFCTLRVLETIGDAALRFSEIQRGVGTVNPVTLTSRLKKLEEAGVIDRRTETVDKQSVVYALTEKGRDCLPVIEAIKSFTFTHII